MNLLERGRLALKILSSPSAELGEVGRPGTKHWSGKITTDEYVPELKGAKALDVYEKMRADAACAAAIRSLKMPLRSAQWDIEPPEAPSDAEREATDRLRWNLFEGMSMTWEDHLRQLLTHFDFGHYVCEKVWQVSDDMPSTWPTLEFRRGRGDIMNFTRDRETDVYRWDGSAAVVDRKTFYVGLGRFAREPMITLRKLAPRQQRTIDKWNLAPDGGLISVTQRLTDLPGVGTATIPIEKLLVFVHEKEAAAWTGRSALRPAYKHWFMADQLYRISAMQAERHAVGIPVMTVPKDKSEDEKALARAEDILAGVRAHEKSYVVEIEGYPFRVEGMGEGKAMDLLPMIQFHAWMITVSVLAQHLMLGSSDTGSHALAGDDMSMFLMVEEAYGRDICAVHNRYLIPQWMQFNYGDTLRPPKLTVARIETRDTAKVIAAVGNAVQSGAMKWDLALDNYLRRRMGLPALTKDPTPAPAIAPVPAPTKEEDANANAA